MNEILTIESNNGFIQVVEVVCSIAHALQPIDAIDLGYVLYSIEKSINHKIPEWETAREWTMELNEHDSNFIKNICPEFSEKLTSSHISKLVREYDERRLEELTTLNQKKDYYAKKKINNIKMIDCFMYEKLLNQAESKFDTSKTNCKFILEYKSDFLEAKNKYDKVRDGHFDNLNEMLKKGSLKGVLTADRIPPKELGLTMQIPIDEVRAYLKSIGFQLQVKGNIETKGSFSHESDNPSDPKATIVTADAGSLEELRKPETKSEQDWNLKEPKKNHGYTRPLYEFLKEAKTQGRPLPKAYDVLAAFRDKPPQQVISFDQDGFSYYDSYGKSQSADIKAIREAIRRMTPK